MDIFDWIFPGRLFWDILSVTTIVRNATKENNLALPDKKGVYTQGMESVKDAVIQPGIWLLVFCCNASH